LTIAFSKNKVIPNPMCAMHRYSTRFQIQAQRSNAQPTKAQPIQAVEAPKANVPDKPKAEVPDMPKATVLDMPKTHRYETRLQSRLKKDLADCKKISELVQAATITPDITSNPERLYAIAAFFEELCQMNFWKKYMRINAIIRMKISEFRDAIHMIRTSSDETAGIVISGRTIHMGHEYITAARRTLYAMDALETRMNA
jgi:hypothetical protein